MSSVNYYLDHYVPANKLVIILPTIGFAYKSDDDRPILLKELSGLYKDDKGYHTFYEVSWQTN